MVIRDVNASRRHVVSVVSRQFSQRMDYGEHVQHEWPDHRCHALGHRGRSELRSVLVH
jgi:hypothetical protein